MDTFILDASDRGNSTKMAPNLIRKA